jgi:drug/metabolite transporter (DMT)-like permease
MALLPIFEILLANLIWGFGFVATIWALESFSWEQIFLYRFLLAGTTGLLIYLVFSRKNIKNYIKASFLPSIFLCLEIVFQIFSLQFTKATEGGFLFVTYIIMIPLLEYLLYKKYLPAKQFAWIIMGIIGSYLMVNGGEISLGKGELTMLLSALCASAHVLAIDRIDKSDLNPFYLNVFQLLWGILLTSPFYFFVNHHIDSTMSINSIVGLLSVAFGSTLLAYFLQIKAQEKISPSMISILFLVESTFSAIFAFFLLGERITAIQWIGAIVISLSAVAVSLDFIKSTDKTI